MMAHIREALANAIYPEGRAERRSLERKADIDELTQMGNRRAFQKAIFTAEQDPELSVVIFDVNNLGLVNKMVGHQEGDARIQWAAEVITMVTSALGEPDRCFRVGGDEFVVFVQWDNATELVRSVQEIHGAIQYGQVVVSIAGSVGDNFAEADQKLQGRKAETKRRYDKAA